MKPPHPSRFFSVVLGCLLVGLVVSLIWGQREPEKEVALPVTLPNLSERMPDVNQPQTPSVSSVACENLHEFVCGESRILEDPTGLVQPDVAGEVEALRIYETIIHQHPKWTSAEVDEALVKEIYTERRRKRLMETFQWVKGAMIRAIDKEPIAFTLKRKLKDRIRSTELQLPPPASIYASEPELFTKNDVYYGSFPNGVRAVRVGGAYVLTAKSLFNKIFTFAHELAHAIDPCDLKSLGVSLAPYGKLLQCFHRMGWSFQDKMKSVDSCLGESLVSEVFADWMATQITADVIRQYQSKFKKPEDVLYSVINSVRDLCHQESWLEQDLRAHPSPQKRISSIFGYHPGIRALLGCQPVSYCAFQGSSP